MMLLIIDYSLLGIIWICLRMVVLCFIVKLVEVKRRTKQTEADHAETRINIKAAIVLPITSDACFVRAADLTYNNHHISPF